MFSENKNHIDLPILLAVLTLMFLSLGIVYSASASYAQFKYGRSEQMLISHAIKVFIGILGLFLFMRVDYKILKRFTKFALVVAVIMLLVTFLLGGETKGATRWLRYSSISLQPSEFAKYALLFHLSTLLAIKHEIVHEFKKGFFPLIFWIVLITLLVMVQPNFSMGTMIFVLSLIMLYIGNVRFKHLALTFVSLLPLIVIYLFSASYRYKRIMEFINGISASQDKLDYQPWQSIIGFGNGGIFGVGLGESKQRDFFLPESYGDFVFSIVGEEYGFIGTMFFMLLFLLIMYRGFKISKYSSDFFGKYLAIAITSTITLYALINAGVTLGILPTTGLPMPFVSYGGSSMVFSACAVGVLLNISSQTDLHPRATEIPIVGLVNSNDVKMRKVY